MREALEHGKRNEKHAVATLQGTVMPMICDKDDVYVEDGANFINSTNGKPMIEASSDGTVQEKHAVQSTVAKMQVCDRNKMSHSKGH